MSKKKTYKAVKSSPFHERKVRAGTYGELSKIQEELDEAIDAEEQGIDLLVLIELSDIIGAVAGVAEEKYGFTLEGLIKFSERVRDVKHQEALKAENEANEKKAERAQFLTKMNFAIRQKYRENREEGRKAAKKAKEIYGLTVDLTDLESEMTREKAEKRRKARFVPPEDGDEEYWDDVPEPDGLEGQLVNESTGESKPLVENEPISEEEEYKEVAEENADA